MFPWLAHGHIFPYLELAKRILIRKNFHIYFCSTAINFSSINQFIQKNSLDNSIELVQLHLQPSIELPPHYHTTKNLPSNLNFTLLKAFQTAKSSFADIINKLKPDLVIYDIFQPWAAKIALSLNISAVHFAAFGAATVSFVHHHYNCWDDNFPFTALCLEDHEKKSVDALIEFLGFEGKYIDYASAVSRTKMVPVGPLVTGVCENAEESSEIDEIAKGLELSGVNFIWVIRFPVEEKNISIEEAIPEGFLDRMKNRGKIVSGWAPQANILGHPNTGMPMKLNMYIDARMLVDAGACVEVKREENEVFKGEEVAKVINQVIVGKTGEVLRQRAQELSEKMRMEEEQALTKRLSSYGRFV
ncbi:hypothetical protein DH2020_043303 [Rehmannia glutinosa]|uniref:Uncharacterized protein n=1 Tax=Rehmannia glutinosa TaxID=99300 RepID=A0ABR0UK22_REHGL